MQKGPVLPFTFIIRIPSFAITRHLPQLARNSHVVRRQGVR